MGANDEVTPNKTHVAGGIKRPNSLLTWWEIEVVVGAGRRCSEFNPPNKRAVKAWSTTHWN